MSNITSEALLDTSLVTPAMIGLDAYSAYNDYVKRHESIYDKDVDAAIAELISPMSEPLVHSVTASELPRRRVYDDAGIERIIGFNFTDISLLGLSAYHHFIYRRHVDLGMLQDDAQFDSNLMRHITGARFSGSNERVNVLTVPIGHTENRHVFLRRISTPSNFVLGHEIAFIDPIVYAHAGSSK